MRKWTIALCWLAGWMWTGAAAQSWTVFTPAERDFRVLFPEPPVRSAEAEGTVSFKARRDEAEYIVYRHDARRLIGVDPRAQIIRRLEASGSEDRAVRQVRDEGDNSEPTEYVFTRGGTSSIHRVFADRGRYYEVVVQAPRNEFRVARQTARDFFGSFSMTGVGVTSILTRLGVTLDALCRDRTDVFSRTFCEYAICLQPGYEQYPHCTKLLGR